MPISNSQYISVAQIGSFTLEVADVSVVHIGHCARVIMEIYASPEERMAITSELIGETREITIDSFDSLSAKAARLSTCKITNHPACKPSQMFLHSKETLIVLLDAVSVTFQSFDLP